MKSDRRVRNIAEIEAEKHLAMLNKCFAPWGNRQEWENKYKREHDITKNIFVVEEEGKWIGGGSALWRRVLISEKEVRAYIPSDLYTLPEHTGKGVYSTAMKALNDYATNENTALGIAFISLRETPYKALPKYGFTDVFYYDTYIKILKPESFIHLIDRENIRFLEKLGKIYLNIITDAENVLLKIENGIIHKTDEAVEVDIVIKSDFNTLFSLYSSTFKGKVRLVIETTLALLRRKLSVRTSLRNRIKMLRIALRW